MLRFLILPLLASIGLAQESSPTTSPETALPKEDAPEQQASAELEQEAPTSPRISSEADWPKWERIGRIAMSPEGRWVAYTISRGDGTGELRLRVIATDATETFEQGTGPQFSSDGKWLSYSITKSEKERAKLEKKKETVTDDLGLFNLVSGDRQEVKGIGRSAFSADGAFLAMLRAGDGAEGSGADLLVRDLSSGIDTHFGRVGAFAWSDEGAWLATTIDAPDKSGNGVRVLNATTGQLRTLASAEQDFKGLTWRKDALDLAVMGETSYEKDEDSTFTVLAYSGIDKGAQEMAYSHLEDAGFPEDMRVVDYDGLRWSDDGKALFFGVKEWDEKPAELSIPADEDQEDKEDGATEVPTDGEAEEQPGESADPAPVESKAKSLREELEEAPGVEIWHAKDIDIIPRQKRRARSAERRNYRAVLWLDSKTLVRLESGDIEDVEVLEGTTGALGFDRKPYEAEQRFSATVADVYAVDVMTGEKARVLERVKYTSTGDPKGRRFLFVRDDDVWSYDLEAREAINLTGDIDTAFINQEDSSLTDQKPMYGVAGWLEDGSGVLLYSRYDIWHFHFDGGEATALTSGAETALRHRRARVAADRDDDEFVDLTEGFYVSLYGDRTKQSGYGHVGSNGECKTLLLHDAQVGRLARAEEADVFTLTRERFDDSPDVFVAGKGLKDPKQISVTNVFTEDFAWGHSELVDYESAAGVPLQGALFYPADYDPSKTYPMVVYIYELRSQTLHQYQRPSERNPYSTSVFTQNGYFVFQPDIVYRPQNPGVSAVECVVPAVRKVLESGMVDPKRVGLMGHSWGAYQTAFIVTQTDLFAAGVAGAPLTNMMSMSMSIYWNSGQTDAYIFHESQGRMDRPFWRDLDTYIANSPIFSIEDLNTPLLVTFGDEDGAVDWQQGVEMYNAARLAQRPFVMLVYPGENHGLAKKANQVDYHHRVRAWFDTHLRGAEAEPWITEGMPWIEQKKALERDEKTEKSKGGK